MGFRPKPVHSQGSVKREDPLFSRKRLNSAGALDASARDVHDSHQNFPYKKAPPSLPLPLPFLFFSQGRIPYHQDLFPPPGRFDHLRAPRSSSSVQPFFANWACLSYRVWLDSCCSHSDSFLSLSVRRGPSGCSRETAERRKPRIWLNLQPLDTFASL